MKDGNSIAAIRDFVTLVFAALERDHGIVVSQTRSREVTEAFAFGYAHGQRGSDLIGALDATACACAIAQYWQDEPSNPLARFAREQWAHERKERERIELSLRADAESKKRNGES